MLQLAIGYVSTAIGRKACDDATNSVKLLSTGYGSIRRRQPEEWRGQITAELQLEICNRLRVNNARCYEDVAVKSAEFREV